MRTQKELLHELMCNTHVLWRPEFVDEINTAFGTKLEAQRYKASNDPKGLTLNNGASAAIGIASFDLAHMLCGALNVKYAGMLGRGFQVRVCVEALQAAGYGQDK